MAGARLHGAVNQRAPPSAYSATPYPPTMDPRHLDPCQKLRPPVSNHNCPTTIDFEKHCRHGQRPCDRQKVVAEGIDQITARRTYGRGAVLHADRRREHADERPPVSRSPLPRAAATRHARQHPAIGLTVTTGRIAVFCTYEVRSPAWTVLWTHPKSL